MIDTTATQTANRAEPQHPPIKPSEIASLFAITAAYIGLNLIKSSLLLIAKVTIRALDHTLNGTTTLSPANHPPRFINVPRSDLSSLSVFSNDHSLTASTSNSSSTTAVNNHADSLNNELTNTHCNNPINNERQIQVIQEILTIFQQPFVISANQNNCISTTIYHPDEEQTQRLGTTSQNNNNDLDEFIRNNNLSPTEYHLNGDHFTVYLPSATIHPERTINQAIPNPLNLENITLNQAMLDSLLNTISVNRFAEFNLRALSNITLNRTVLNLGRLTDSETTAPINIAPIDNAPETTAPINTAAPHDNTSETTEPYELRLSDEYQTTIGLVKHNKDREKFDQKLSNMVEQLSQGKKADLFEIVSPKALKNPNHSVQPGFGSLLYKQYTQAKLNNQNIQCNDYTITRISERTKAKTKIFIVTFETTDTNGHIITKQVKIVEVGPSYKDRCLHASDLSMMLKTYKKLIRPNSQNNTLDENNNADTEYPCLSSFAGIGRAPTFALFYQASLSVEKGTLNSINLDQYFENLIKKATDENPNIRVTEEQITQLKDATNTLVQNKIASQATTQEFNYS